MSKHPYLAVTPKPLAFAHRGGARRHPENTLLAFEAAHRAGCTHIETDLYVTSDGVIVCHHDPTVDRTTDGHGRVDQMTFAELRALDAGYRFTPDGGASYPHRGQGIVVPTLEEALDALPDAFFNLEIKADQQVMIPALAELIERRRLHARVLVASAEAEIVIRFREVSRHTVVTSAGGLEAFLFWAAVRTRTHRFLKPGYQALQVPLTHHGLRVVDRRFVEAAHAHGIDVHVWTIDDAATMRHLVDLGVDAVMSDVPDILLDVLGRRLDDGYQ